VTVELDCSQLRLPAPGEQRASRQQSRRGGAFARADGERKLGQARGRRGVGAGADGARASAACAPVSRVRARAAAGPTESCAHVACVAACRAGGTPAVVGVP